MEHKKKPKNKLREFEFVLFFYHVIPRNLPQTVRRDGQHLYCEPSHPFRKPCFSF